MNTLLALVLSQNLNQGVPTIRLPDGGLRVAAHVEGSGLGGGGVGSITIVGGAAIPTCSAGQVVTADGGVFSCVTPAGGSGGAPVDGGYVVWTSVGSTNERVLSNGTNTVIDTATPGQIQIDLVTPVATATALAADPTACGAGNFVSDVAADGTLTCSTPAGTYVLPDATDLVTGGIRLTGDLGGTATSPSVVDDSHNHTGTTISALDTGDITTGTLAQARGGTGATALTCAAGERLTSNGTAYSCSALPATPSAYATIQDEATPLTQRTTINFTGSAVTCTDTGTVTECSITGGGGGGGGSVHTAAGSAYFDGGSLDAYTTVTAAWSSPTHTIVCRPTGEESSVEGAQATVLSQSAGSFVVRTEPRQGSHRGNLPFVCLGH